MKVEHTYVKSAGVYRCCLATVATEFLGDSRIEVVNGQKSKCTYCGDEFTLVDGTWTPDWQIPTSDSA